jgi:Ca-activated chloride channel family protein
MSMIRYAAFAIALAAPFSLHVPAHAAELKLEADLGQTVLSTAKPGNVYLRLNLKSLAASNRERRPPINAAIVIDRSGSMQGDRIEAAKEGARVALKRLSSDDTVALISYNHDVEVLSPAAPLRASREKLIEAIDKLEANGTTGLYAGVKEGGKQIEEFVSDNNVNRVILLSDGLANVGPSTPGELAELGRKLASKGISVSTIGLGLEYNEDLMQRHAAASDGNHVFVERPSDLAEIFDREFGDALSVSARDITIIIECKAGFTPKRILGRDGSIAGGKVTLKLNQLQAENERYVVVELQAPEGRSEGAADVADVSVTYIDLDDGGKPARAEAKSSVRFSASAKDIEDGLNKPVMSQVTRQIATENSEQAVELRDKGDIAGARKVLEENAEYIKRSRDVYTAGAAPAPSASVGALTDLENKSREAASSLDGDSWDRTRKLMRQDQHKTKVQQAY